MLVPGGRRFDWPKVRAHLGVKRLSLPDADEAHRVTGYERGAITPFGASRAWPVDRRRVGIEVSSWSPSAAERTASTSIWRRPTSSRALGAELVDVTVPEGPVDAAG